MTQTIQMEKPLSLHPIPFCRTGVSKKPPANRRTIINLSDDSDKPVEHIPDEPFITKETRQRAKTHNCTVCNRRGHDEVHCYRYQCKFCHGNAPGHLPSECLENPSLFLHHLTT